MTTRDDSLLTRDDYQSAIDVQNACNLSGIVQSFAYAMPRIWNVARTLGYGTDWVNTHPLCRMYANQIVFLSSATGIGYSDFRDASEFCNAVNSGTIGPDTDYANWNVSDDTLRELADDTL